VADRQKAGGQSVLRALREFRERQPARDLARLLTERLRDRGGIAAVCRESGVGFRFVERREIFPRAVLGELDEANLIVREFANRRGNFGEAGQLGGPVAAGAAYDLECRAVAILMGANDERFEDANLLDAAGELFELCRIEVFARVRRRLAESRAGSFGTTYCYFGQSLR
jgi:hypothetical protein